MKSEDSSEDSNEADESRTYHVPMNRGPQVQVPRGWRRYLPDALGLLVPLIVLSASLHLHLVWVLVCSVVLLFWSWLVDGMLLLLLCDAVRGYILRWWSLHGD